ncbi:MAG: hypothetical protein DHS20C13_10400 [Thermodesulfobacteriota bacterium]|nr:MAG: hypothetical protein DHS20C13_10400 [Thermodesulfobacteriota bacterium]
MQIKLKRVYEEPANSDGIRILVERLWPRGLSKEKAKVDIWLKDAAPSTELRKWFNHDRAKWEEFKKRYYIELDQNPEALKPIYDLPNTVNITFVYASKEEQYNNSVALRNYISNYR